jgi:hypothetical protein
MTQAADIALFFEACEKGDLECLRRLVGADPNLVRLGNPAGRYRNWTGLHSAAQKGHTDAVRFLLEHGADPNAREEGDNTYPLHWAAAGGHLETARALLNAGGDVHGFGDVHELDVIGWATVWRCFEGRPAPEMVALLRRSPARAAHGPCPRGRPFVRHAGPRYRYGMFIAPRWPIRRPHKRKRENRGQ